MRFEDHEYYVYILSSRSRTLYIGVTNNLWRRIAQHRTGKADSFTSRYKIHRLVYFERFQYINNAIAREKYLKHFTRQEKIALIEATNPTWEDLTTESSTTHQPRPIG
jgi:putative endonuclease